MKMKLEMEKAKDFLNWACAGHSLGSCGSERLHYLTREDSLLLMALTLEWVFPGAAEMNTLLASLELLHDLTLPPLEEVPEDED